MLVKKARKSDSTVAQTLVAVRQTDPPQVPSLARQPARHRPPKRGSASLQELRRQIVSEWTTCADASPAENFRCCQLQELMDFMTVLDWKSIDKADFCLGAAVVPLSGPGIEEATCGIPVRGNERQACPPLQKLGHFHRLAAHRFRNRSEQLLINGLCSLKTLSKTFDQAFVRSWRFRPQNDGVVTTSDLDQPIYALDRKCIRDPGAG